MIRIMQRQINDGTRKLDKEVTEGGKPLDEGQKARLRRLAVQEGQVARITRKLAEQVERQGEGAAEGGAEMQEGGEE
jgi:hypothetical protein